MAQASDITVFDRDAVRLHRDRAARNFTAHDFLFREVAERLADRLDGIKRTFPRAADIGCRSGFARNAFQGRAGIEALIGLDPSPAFRPDVVADEEFLPLADQSLDLAISCLALHWVNDLPGALIQIRRALKPDGLFLAAMLGGDTLSELRGALMESELAEEGGVSPRASPLAALSDAAGLLQRAGFALPVADSETITVTYDDAFALMRDLRGMGETNAAALRRRNFSRRATLFGAVDRYRIAHAKGARIPATFEVLFLTGWAPHESQQQPKRPGSAKARLADALGTVERPAGDKAKP
jgi:SAM-dependent methyltransferase